MARMHSPKRGKSGSKHPVKPGTPDWVRLKEKEIEMLIVKMAKDRQSAAEIGLHLRDTYGIPSVQHLLGKKINKIIDEKGVKREIPDDLKDLLRKSVFIRKHLETNNQDKVAKRGLTLTESKIQRLRRYYVKKGKVDESWKYDPKQASFFIE